MDLLSIGQLVTITGGQLLLGNMPPLGGDYEPVRRIVHAAEPNRPGDVVFHTTADANRCCWLEGAYSRGALGVIADSRLTPWDGKFALQVTDPGRAVGKLAGWLRTRWASVVTLIITPPGSPTSECECQIKRELERFTATTLDPSAAPQDGHTRPWLWPLIGNYQRLGAVLLAAEANRIQPQEIVDCQPDVVVLAPEFVTGNVARDTIHSKHNQDDEPVNCAVDLQPFRSLQRGLAPLSHGTILIAPEPLMPRLVRQGRRVRPYPSNRPRDAGRVCAQAVGQVLGPTSVAAG